LENKKYFFAKYSTAKYPPPATVRYHSVWKALTDTAAVMGGNFDQSHF